MSCKKLVFIQEIIPTYRLPFFNKLAQKNDISLTVISETNGHDEFFGNINNNEVNFRWIILNKNIIFIFKKKFVWFSQLINRIFKIRPDVIITIGNKRVIQNHILILFRFLLKYKLYFMQHAQHYGKVSKIFRILEKTYLKYYITFLSNGIILYTKHEKEKLIKSGFNPKKLFFINNTLDTQEIMKLSDKIKEDEINNILHRYQLKKTASILFIGRLIKGKKVELVFEYFEKLKSFYPDVQLIIIGDGPLAHELKAAFSSMPDVVFIGKLYDEKTIACIMRVCKFVFLPGYSGLSIIHAFAYGKPFITFESEEHKSEINYVHHGINGFILKKNEFKTNLLLMHKILTKDSCSHNISKNALETAREHPIEIMVDNLTDVIMRRN